MYVIDAYVIYLVIQIDIIQIDLNQLVVIYFRNTLDQTIELYYIHSYIHNLILNV